ncbi:MAG: polyprenyl synthetase family protein, partial [Candidatus Eisenbacteria bacterium]
MNSRFERALERLVPRVDRALERLLPRATEEPRRLHQAIRYSVFAGGKRLRPVLCLLACDSAGGKIADALPSAAALEMIHTFSLIHDDLPGMDDDDWRRGRRSNHIVFGEGMAILAGDALLNLAFQTLARAPLGRARDPRDLWSIVGAATGTDGLPAAIRNLTNICA